MSWAARPVGVPQLLEEEPEVARHTQEEYALWVAYHARQTAV